MPVQHTDDGTPIVGFEPAIEISPFELFTRLRENQDRPVLVDLRRTPTDWRLRGSIRASDTDLEPPADRDTVFYDQAGDTSPAVVAGWRDRGFSRTWALMGGMDLYSFCLDASILDTDTFLERIVDRTG